MGTRLITSYVVWICVCWVNFSYGNMVQVSGVPFARYRAAIPPGRPETSAFFRRGYRGIFDCFFFRCHPLVNRKDGSRLLRFFPVLSSGGHFSDGPGPARSPRRKSRRNRRASAISTCEICRACRFLNETPSLLCETRLTPRFRPSSSTRPVRASESARTFPRKII